MEGVRINPNRGNWVMTLTGESDISRHLRLGGYIGVRRRLPNGQFELLTVIDIPARPTNRLIRGYRRDIYIPTRLVDDEIQIGERLANPSAETLDVRIGQDGRGILLNNNPNVLRSRLAAGDTLDLPHDSMPRNSRGNYRIAAQEKNNFVVYNDVITCVRYLLLRGVTYVGGVPLELGEGNFASAPITFRIPNQPTAPATNRMAMTAGRNGAPWFISRTTAHMRVRLGYDAYTGDAVWGQLAANNTINDLIALFEEGGHDLPATFGGNYAFELRIFRNNRIVSAPDFLHVNRAEFHANTAVTATITPVTITGTQYDNRTTNDNPLNRAGINVTLATSGGQTNAQLREDVTDWFINLPDGLTATVNQVTAGGSRIRVNIHGVPTEPADAPLTITIPANRFIGGVTATDITASGDAMLAIATAPPLVAPDSPESPQAAPDASEPIPESQFAPEPDSEEFPAEPEYAYEVSENPVVMGPEESEELEPPTEQDE